MSRTYVVRMPWTEACHLAGTGEAGPGTAEGRCLAAIGEWLHGLSGRRSATVPVAKVVTELGALLSMVPPATHPVRGPFARPADGSSPPPGRVEYLGDGRVRLDEAAISSLAQLPAGHDFRATLTDAGPVLTVGPAVYLARPDH